MMRVAKDALGDAERTGYLPARAEAREMLGRAEARSEDATPAEATLYDAAFDAEASHDDAALVETWPTLVEVQVQRYEVDRADDSVRHAEAALARVGGNRALEAELEEDRSDLAHDRNKYGEAVEHARAALAITEGAFGGSDARVAFRLHTLASQLTKLGQYDEAIALLNRALSVLDAALGPDHPRVASVLAALSNVYEYKGDVDAAISYGERAVALGERVLGPDHPRLGSFLMLLGNAQEDTGDVDKAIATYQRGRALTQPASAEISQQADILYDLAVAYQRKGAAGDSLRYAARSVEVQEKLKGPNHTDVAIALDVVAGAQSMLGRTREAEDLHRKALSILQAGFGENHPDVAAALTHVGTDELALHDPGAPSPISSTLWPSSSGSGRESSIAPT